MAATVDPATFLGHRLEVGDLDLQAAFQERPLDAASLRCLQYMHDIESHTVCYLRDTLVTPAHEDPRLTTFLTMWVYEEHWHGEALATVLRAHGCPAGHDRVRPLRAQLGRSQRWRPVSFVLGSLVVPDMVAVHMAWGAVNELTTQAGYAQLARKAGHPVLSELLRRIMRQEGRHVDFYAGEARARLEASRAAQRVTRAALARLWRPVGHGVRPAVETDFLIAHLFAGEDGSRVAARIDRHVDRLPGLAGLDLVSSVVRRRAGLPASARPAA